ncbi:hypothetical protein Taro_033016 [Colocasia esculenta]|uniref:Uncharacterized protein n=1 Tax=Colocasia esculenta TaxID=4460 RepID=A0A843W3K2_COLES|nr:hypothetical protein [Colocasia esculenta]
MNVRTGIDGDETLVEETVETDSERGPWLREVGVVERRPVRTSRDVTSGRSNRPQHRKALYFPHCRLWITEYSCKVWCKPCRRRPIPSQHSRHSWRPSHLVELIFSMSLPQFTPKRKSLSSKR